MRRTPESEPEPSESEAVPFQGVWSRRTIWVFCAVILGFGWVDTLYLGHLSVWAVGFRCAWALSVVGNTYLLKRVPGSWVRPLTDLHILIISVSVLGITFEMGGVGSAYFIMVSSLPLTSALVYHWHRRAVLLSGVVGLAGTLLLVLTQGHRLTVAFTWVAMMMGTLVLAMHYSRQVLKVKEAEHQARLERTRREALEALTLSEHRRAQSEKLAIVGRLASGVAHEINNPLAYVGSNVDFVRDELLAQRELDRKELLEVLAETRVGLQHIRQIIDDLRGFARMDAHEPAACSLADVVADALKLASLRLKNVAFLRVEVPADLPEIFAVRQRLVQVVINLLVNAGDALESHRVEGGEVRVTGHTEEARVVLLIEDNGPGFAPHVLPRLFEAFFTTKGLDKGTGLGLTLSRELVEQFGGSLSASNRPEGGARLRIELPVRRADPSEVPSTEGEREAQGAA